MNFEFVWFANLSVGFLIGSWQLVPISAAYRQICAGPNKDLRKIFLQRINSSIIIRKVSGRISKLHHKNGHGIRETTKDEEAPKM